MESVRTAELVAATLSIAGQEGRRMRLRTAEKKEMSKVRDREWRRKEVN
jgi:small subunit ribosomal protein S2